MFPPYIRTLFESSDRSRQTASFFHPWGTGVAQSLLNSSCYRRGGQLGFRAHERRHNAALSSKTHVENGGGGEQVSMCVTNLQARMYGVKSNNMLPLSPPHRVQRRHRRKRAKENTKQWPSRVKGTEGGRWKQKGPRKDSGRAQSQP